MSTLNVILYVFCRLLASQIEFICHYPKEKGKFLISSLSIIINVIVLGHRHFLPYSFLPIYLSLVVFASRAIPHPAFCPFYLFLSFFRSFSISLSRRFVLSPSSVYVLINLSVCLCLCILTTTGQLHAQLTNTSHQILLVLLQTLSFQIVRMQTCAKLSGFPQYRHFGGTLFFRQTR